MQLTPAQRSAAEYAGSPLIVLAGPGTGKTRTMVHRIAHQTRERSIEPERIVALTFTVKAANQLRERLAEVIGVTQAQRINAHTIHAFGHRLLHRFGDMLGLPARLDPIDPAQSSRLFKKIVLDHGLFSESRAEGLSNLAVEVLAAFDSLANMGLPPRACSDFADAWARRLEGSSRPDPEQYAAERARLRRFSDTALAYALYTQECHRRGWISFADLVTLPIRLLSERPQVAAICRDDFRAFIVDEFQDCNPAQIELLRLLAPPSSNPDLCVVGDDDQAIYRFRGADEQAFRRFAQVWTVHKVIPLKENYRSQPELIQVANAIITRAQVRFAPDKVIEFPKDKEPSPSSIQAIKLEDDQQDADVIASMILADRACTSKAGATRPWRRYAVIARSHGDLDRIAAALRVEDIPFERVKEKSQLEDAGVEDVLAWIEWLINPEASWAARRVLTRPPYGLAPELVTQWEREYSARASQATAGREGTNPPGRYVDWIEQQSRAEWPAGASAAAKYRDLLAAVSTARADESVFRIMLATDAAHAEMLPGRQRARRVAALVALLALAREKQPRLDAPGDLRELWSYLEELRQACGYLPPAKTLAEALDRDEPTTTEGDEAGGRVQLLTAHNAKGLEFDTVFVTRVCPPNGFPISRGEEGWEPPEGLFDPLDARSAAERRADEERRLFYVACTRAERRLVLLSRWNKNPSKTTHFFEELVRTNREKLPISLHESADVLKAAADLGVGVAGRSSIELAGHDYQSRELIKDAADRVRRRGRLEAALALEAVERSDLAPEHLGAVIDRLRAVAGQVAAASQVERAGAVPQWLLKLQPDLIPLARQLEGSAKAAGAEQGRSAASILLAPMPAPLSLSYTIINEYHKCPRCFYLSKVMRLPEQESLETGVGIIAHEVLKDFFNLWARAEADGQPTPGLDQLLAMTRAEYLSSLHDQEKVSKEILDQLAAQMRLLFERLHANGRPAPHILENERAINFDYELDGTAHKFTSKIDRIDQLPDGGIRIIDYKTGQARKCFTEPEKDDLQLGIYALALKLGKGLGWAVDGQLKGVAEYWCLSTGERGTISLTDLDEGKVRAAIDKAARGMLEGRFEADPRCKGPCRLFAD
jgi:DNA helicase-2/ATP-dependent DNA helicase PcrA